MVRAWRSRTDHIQDLEILEPPMTGNPSQGVCTLTYPIAITVSPLELSNEGEASPPPADDHQRRRRQKRRRRTPSAPERAVPVAAPSSIVGCCAPVHERLGPREHVADDGSYPGDGLGVEPVFAAADVLPEEGGLTEEAGAGFEEALEDYETKHGINYGGFGKPRNAPLVDARTESGHPEAIESHELGIGNQGDGGPEVFSPLDMASLPPRTGPLPYQVGL